LGTDPGCFVSSSTIARQSLCTLTTSGRISTWLMWPPRYAVRDIVANALKARNVMSGRLHDGSFFTVFHCQSASHEKNPVRPIRSVAHSAESSCSWIALDRTFGGSSLIGLVPRSHASAADPDV